MRLRRYFLRRVLQIIPVVLVVIVINFVLIRLAPGDVAVVMAGENADPSYVEAVRVRYGLDKSISRQLLIYLGSLLRGDLGTSYVYGQPVGAVIGMRMGPTVLLALVSLLSAAGLGTIVGTMMSRRLGSRLDTVVCIGAIVSCSIPAFWLGLMMILLFSVRLGWFPASGMYSIGSSGVGLARVGDMALHLIMPATTLACVYFGEFVRLSRASVTEMLNEGFVVMARAIGFSERTILIKHALRNALLPLVTMFGLQLGLVLAGAVLTETVFAWPGIGRLLYESILARDIPVIVGTYIVLAICVAVCSLITDLVYAYVDPRVGYK